MNTSDQKRPHIWKELSLSNFKSWKSLPSLRLAPLTALFGTNSSGKSSILQWFLMMRQTVESADRRRSLDLGTDRSVVELGTFDDVVHREPKGNSTRVPRSTLGWTVAWETTDLVEDVANAKAEPRRITFSAEIGSTTHHAPTTLRLEYRTSHAYTYFIGDDGDYHFDTDDHGLTRRRGRPTILPHPDKCYGFPEEIDRDYQHAAILSDLKLALERQFLRIEYLGPLRDHPRRQYLWGGGEPGDLGRKGEFAVEALLASRESRPAKRRVKQSVSLEESVANWLKKLGLIHDFRVHEISQGSKLYQVLVRRNEGSPEVSIADVGFGVSQVLPVITLCCRATPGVTLLIEQPEIHLHPSAQAGLADLFIETIRKRRAQIILESHSEHLLRRLRLRVAEEKVSSDEIQLAFCEIQGGASQLRSLELDEFGAIKNWPEHFFGNEFGEIADMVQAVAKRKVRA
ncbi:MAG: DUF3696 domain-containing protein [Isosphaeraceae bacterium]|nr:DUF3696 domain-containing protein [Isosphaeraceae bacterium]